MEISGKVAPEVLEREIAKYRDAADAGDAVANFEIGFIYQEACEDAKALHHFRLSAEKGNAMAWNWLGMAHLYGEGVPKNPAEAESCFLRSGNCLAFHNLGKLYEERGDLVKALHYYKLSSEQSWPRDA